MSVQELIKSYIPGLHGADGLFVVCSTRSRMHYEDKSALHVSTISAFLDGNSVRAHKRLFDDTLAIPSNCPSILSLATAICRPVSSESSLAFPGSP